MAAFALYKQFINCRFFSTSKLCMKGRIIDGKLMANQVQNEVREEVEKRLLAGFRRPHLTAILVGNDSASRIYVNKKMKAAAYAGVTSQTIILPESISEVSLLEQLDILNRDDCVDGIIVQLPVPRHICEKKICNAVSPAKDVDGFHVANIGRLCVNMRTIVPATCAAVMEILTRTGILTFGKHVVVCGRSKNIGLPISVLLQSSNGGEGANLTKLGNATTTVCHRNTPPGQLRSLTRTADILISAVGQPGLITADMVKDGAVVIDVGITRVKDEATGKRHLVGDVDFDAVCDKASYITPVPGGVGPMTVAMLMANTLLAAKKEINYDWII